MSCRFCPILAALVRWDSMAGSACKPASTSLGLMLLKSKNFWICEVSRLKVLGWVMSGQDAVSVAVSGNKVVLNGRLAVADPLTDALASVARFCGLNSLALMIPGVGGLSVCGSCSARATLPVMAAVPFVIFTPKNPSVAAALRLALVVSVAWNTGVVPGSTIKKLPLLSTPKVIFSVVARL